MYDTLYYEFGVVTDDVGDQLCERVLSVLIEVWLVACMHHFPPPPLWKTLREMAMNWRHRTALVEQWNRVNLSLTQRLLEFMYGPGFPELKICKLLLGSVIHYFVILYLINCLTNFTHTEVVRQQY